MRDGTRLSYENGTKMMKIFKEAEAETSIFDDFEFMDNREEKLRISREMMNMMYKNMKQMMGGDAKEEEEKQKEDEQRGRRQFKNNYKGDGHYRGHHQHGSNYRGRRQRFNNRRRGGYNNRGGDVYKRKDQGDSHRETNTVYVNKSKVASNGAGKPQNQQEQKPTVNVEPAQILVKKKNKQRKAKRRKNKKGRRREKNQGQDDELYCKKSDYLEEVKQTQAKKRKAQEEESEYEVKNAIVDLPPADN